MAISPQRVRQYREMLSQMIADLESDEATVELAAVAADLNEAFDAVVDERGNIMERPDAPELGGRLSGEEADAALALDDEAAAAELDAAAGDELDAELAAEDPDALDDDALSGLFDDAPPVEGDEDGKGRRGKKKAGKKKAGKKKAPAWLGDDED